MASGVDPTIKLTAAQHRKHFRKGHGPTVATPIFLVAYAHFKLFTAFPALSVFLS